MRRHRPGRAPDERGAILVTVALSMLALLAFAALAVDVGQIYSARRSDQSAADAAALAAAQDLPNTTSAVSTAIRVAEDNLRVDLPASSWNSCGTETGALAVRASGANCISFDAPRNRVRVRIPDQYIATAFAQLVGFDEMRHSAFAVASTRGSGFGGVLPFGMPAGAGSSDGYACVKSGAGGQSEAPCNGPDSGNFGLIDFGFFGSVEIGTTIDCGSGSARRIRFPNNIAVGSDHEVTIKTITDTALVDAPTACESGTPGPNSALTETGNNSGILGDGLIGDGTFSDGGPSRLRRADSRLFGGSGETATVAGATIDSNPLWAFIPPDLMASSTDIPQSCQRDQFTGTTGGTAFVRVNSPSQSNLPASVVNHLKSLVPQDQAVKLMQRCFAHYLGESWTDAGSFVPGEIRSGCGVPPAPCTTPVFSLNSSTTESPDLWDIQYTPRFAYIPELAGAFPSGSSQAVSFARFRATFVQRLTVQNLGNPGYFDPGFAPPSGGKLAINEVTVFVFPTTMLPNGLSGADAPFAVGKNRFVQLVR